MAVQLCEMFAIRLPAMSAEFAGTRPLLRVHRVKPNREMSSPTSSDEHPRCIFCKCRCEDGVYAHIADHLNYRFLPLSLIGSSDRTDVEAAIFARQSSAQWSVIDFRLVIHRDRCASF